MASLQAGAWWPSSSTRAKNRSSGGASTSLATPCERPRRPRGLAEDGSLQWALRQDTGTSRRQLERSCPWRASDECAVTLRGADGRAPASVQWQAELGK